jgi:hypothetical protein
MRDRTKGAPRGTPDPWGAEPGLEEMRRLARWLDDAIRIPGTDIRIGLDALLGLLPGVGDVGTSIVGGYVLLAAARLGAPPSVLLRIALNLGLDAALGAIPVLGDVFDVAFRAHRRNVRILESWIASPAATRRKSGANVLLAALLAIAILGAVGYASWQVVAWAISTIRAW